MLTPNLFHTSQSLSESKNDDFYVSTYEIDSKDLIRIEEMGFRFDTIWAEKSWCYSCGYFEKKKKENWKNNLIFPVSLPEDSNFYKTYSFQLDSNQRDFTSGFDLIHYRYSYSPSEFYDTLNIILTVRDSTDGWKNAHKIDSFIIIKNNS